jgi:isoleucyl-tRNA synthetase
LAALNTLYETMFTLCLTLVRLAHRLFIFYALLTIQSSFIPFTAEIVYQSLRASSPPPKEGEDVRSVHFLQFPTVRSEYFDPVIERQVQRLKAVIELGRIIRDRKTLPIKVPLKELVLFHPDPEYLSDVKSLESYVTAELNIVNVRYTSDEAEVGIKYKATADWPTLGKKLRKDIGKVRSALPTLSSDSCKDFVLNGKMDVNGVELVQGDLVVTRYVDEASANEYESATDNDVICLLDIRRHADLESMALLRVLTSRVNKLRKEAGLKTADQVDIFYQYDDGQEDSLAGAITGNEDYLVEKVGGVPMNQSQMPEGRNVLQTETKKGGEDAGEQYVLSLVERV